MKELNMYITLIIIESPHHDHIFVERRILPVTSQSPNPGLSLGSEDGRVMALFSHKDKRQLNYMSHLYHLIERVYGQFCIETIHGRLKRNREFSGLFVRISEIM